MFIYVLLVSRFCEINAFICQVTNVSKKCPKEIHGDILERLASMKKVCRHLCLNFFKFSVRKLKLKKHFITYTSIRFFSSSIVEHHESKIFRVFVNVHFTYVYKVLTNFIRMSISQAIV